LAPALSHWWWGYSSHRWSKTFIQSLVGDINPIVGRGYLSYRWSGIFIPSLVGDIYPRPIFPRRCLRPPRRQTCRTNVLGDVSTGIHIPVEQRVGRGYSSHPWSGIFILLLVGDIYPRPTFPRRCLRLTTAHHSPRGEGITEQRPPNLRRAFLYLLTATRESIAPLNSASPDSSIRNPRLWATCTRPLSTFKKIFRHG